MYMVYTRRRGEKRAKGDGFATDSIERAKDIAHREMKSWWGQHGVYEWIKVMDLENKKYVYTVSAEEI